MGMIDFADIKFNAFLPIIYIVLITSLIRIKLNELVEACKNINPSNRKKVTYNLDQFIIKKTESRVNLSKVLNANQQKIFDEDVKISLYLFLSNQSKLSTKNQIIGLPQDYKSLGMMDKMALN